MVEAIQTFKCYYPLRENQKKGLEAIFLEREIPLLGRRVKLIRIVHNIATFYFSENLSPKMRELFKNKIERYFAMFEIRGEWNHA